MNLQDLANKYAYAILTCDDSTEDINSVLDSWAEGKKRADVTVWEKFEDCDPEELEYEHAVLADAFLRFHEEARPSTGIEGPFDLANPMDYVSLKKYYIEREGSID